MQKRQNETEERLALFAFRKNRGCYISMRKTVGFINIVLEIIVVACVAFGFLPILEIVFGPGEIVSYIGRIGGAILAALVILCIKGSHDDEKELERLRDLEKKKREDRE